MAYEQGAEYIGAQNYAELGNINNKLGENTDNSASSTIFGKIEKVKEDVASVNTNVSANVDTPVSTRASQTSVDVMDANVDTMLARVPSIVASQTSVNTVDANVDTILARVPSTVASQTSVNSLPVNPLDWYIVPTDITINGDLLPAPTNNNVYSRTGSGIVFAVLTTGGGANSMQLVLDGKIVWAWEDGLTLVNFPVPIKYAVSIELRADYVRGFHIVEKVLT